MNRTHRLPHLPDRGFRRLRQLTLVLTSATTVVVLILRTTFTRSRTSTLLRLYVPLTMMLAACTGAPQAGPVPQQPTAPAAQVAAQPAATPPATQAAEQVAATMPATQVAAQADATVTPMDPHGQTDLITEVDAFLDPMVSAGSFNGSVLLARDGEILLRRGYGMANREHDVPNTPETKFRIGTITMQFTAMAILLLQEQGKLTVSDRVCLYVSDCPAGWQAITIHHLLTHTSGIPELTELAEYEQIKGLPSTQSESMARFRDRPLDFEPGSSGRLSTSNYVVLGHIIQEVASQPYPIFVREQIFVPLGMLDTGYDTRDVIKNRAVGYKGRGRLNADYADMSNLPAAANMYSTVEDLQRWDQALSTEQLVPKRALDTMFTPHANLTPFCATCTAMQYGYGWELNELDGRRWVGHLGAVDGFNGLISRFPDDSTVVIVLSNLEWPDIEVYGISERLSRMIFDR